MVNLAKPLTHITSDDRQRLSSLINSIADGFLAIDNELKVAQYNGAALNILDMNGSIDGKSITQILKLVNSNSQPIDVAELIRTTKTSTVTRDYFVNYEDGSKVALYLSIAPVHTSYGKAGTQHGYVLLLRDITHEKSLEEERDEFISVISHELRTPITIAEGSISNAMLAVERGAKPEILKNALDMAHQQVLFLADMINDLSTLSRAERGKLTVEVESINMHAMLDELVKGYETQAAQKNLYIHAELDDKLEILQSSKLYVEEIIQNFITNAIKYTEAGGITVEAHPMQNGVAVSVRDTGIGISKGDQEKIFDKFFRSEDYRTRSTNGTGLGLYVAMKLMRIVHADIKVDSELNKGSTFTVIFPNLQ
jgi:PAS domain S-box-containing protein